jgi:hypothetical protein
MDKFGLFKIVLTFWKILINGANPNSTCPLFCKIWKQLNVVDWINSISDEFTLLFALLQMPLPLPVVVLINDGSLGLLQMELLREPPVPAFVGFPFPEFTQMLLLPLTGVVIKVSALKGSAKALNGLKLVAACAEPTPPGAVAVPGKVELGGFVVGTNWLVVEALNGCCVRVDNEFNLDLLDHGDIVLPAVPGPPFNEIPVLPAVFVELPLSKLIETV